MDNYRSNAGMQRLLSRQKALQEVGCEVTLPDYQPEIKRLLWVNATPSAPECYLAGGAVELSGKMDYRILYTGNDGALYSYCHADDYRYALPVDPGTDFDPSAGLTVRAETVPESMGGRVSGPRRLALRCRLQTFASLYGYCERGELPDEDTTQRLMGCAPCSHLFFGSSEPQEVGEEIPLESRDESLRVIYSDAHVFVSDAETGSGTVLCRGEIAVKLLAVREGVEEPPFAIHRRIPLRCEVPVEGAEVNCSASAWGKVSGLRVSVEEGKLQCDMTVTLSATAGRNEDFSYVKDLYSTATVCENQYRECVLTGLERLTMGNFTVNACLGEEEPVLREGERLVDAELICLPPLVSEDRGRPTVTGKCLCRLLIGAEGEFAVREQEIPYRYVAEGTLEEDAQELCGAAAEVIACRPRADGGRVFLDAELAVNMLCMSKKQVRMVKNTQMGELLPGKKGAWILCYPAPDDSLWSVGKKYCLPLLSIAEQNQLPEAPGADSAESLSGVRVLLI